MRFDRIEKVCCRPFFFFYYSNFINLSQFLCEGHTAKALEHSPKVCLEQGGLFNAVSISSNGPRYISSHVIKS